MKIEFLYSEVCNLFGDSGNIRYLMQCIGGAEYIFTSLDDEPAFVHNDVSFIYLGPMTEAFQVKVIGKLLPYKKRLNELIENGTACLFTGNAFELLGNYIEDKSRKIRVEALGIFDMYTELDRIKRYNALILAQYEDIEIVGFKSQFSFCYGNTEHIAFAEAQRGVGINRETKREGIKYKNFIGTHILGPLLVMNPPLTQKLFEVIGAKDAELAYKDQIYRAYAKRLAEFKDPKTKIEY